MPGIITAACMALDRQSGLCFLAVSMACPLHFARYHCSRQYGSLTLPATCADDIIAFVPYTAIALLGAVSKYSSVITEPGLLGGPVMNGPLYLWPVLCMAQGDQVGVHCWTFVSKDSPVKN